VLASFAHAGCFHQRKNQNMVGKNGPTLYGFDSFACIRRRWHWPCLSTLGERVI